MNEPHLANPETNPSFTKGLFCGEIREELVFPYPVLSAEERESLGLILGSFRSWAADTVDAAKHDHDGQFGPGVREGMAELGLMGLNIPEEYGGFGASAKVFNRVFGEIGATDGALAVYFGAHQSIGCKGITLFGTEAQKQKYLPRCASGELVAAFCLTEPGSGSDAQAMKATATPSADGTHYLLSGTKIWISNAGFAGLFTVFAKVPVEENGKKKNRVTAFIVDAKAPGVSLGKLEDKLGIKASDTRGVFFDNVKVPVEDRLGDVGHGFRIALEILNSGRLGLSAASARGTRRLMEEALRYAKQREQFGRPIGSFEMIQRKFATFAYETYALDSAWMLTADMVDRGGVDFSLETAACKIHGSELAFKAASEAMQVAGGIGYSKEFPYERGLRDARINLIFEGTNEILRALVALMGLQQPGERLRAMGKAFRNPLHSLGVIGGFLAGKAKKTVSTPEFKLVHPEFAGEAAQVAELVKDLGAAVERVLMKHGKDVIDKQFLQERMANASIDIYLSTAVLSRVTAALEHAPDSANTAWEVECARSFISTAYRRARRNIRGLTRHRDERLKWLAERALDSGELLPASPTD